MKTATIRRHYNGLDLFVFVAVSLFSCLLFPFEWQNPNIISFLVSRHRRRRRRLDIKYGHFLCWVSLAVRFFSSHFRCSKLKQDEIQIIGESLYTRSTSTNLCSFDVVWRVETKHSISSKPNNVLFIAFQFLHIYVKISRSTKREDEMNGDDEDGGGGGFGTSNKYKHLRNRHTQKN